MAKQLSMLLVIAALLAVALVGFLFLYLSPCGVTVENFQDAPAAPEKPAFEPPVVEDAPPPPMQPSVQAFKKPLPAPSKTLAPPQALPQAGVPAIKSMPPPPQPIAAPTPIAPTPASSAAALTLTPAQCSSLCPVTQESCESKFSCQTRLEPIGTTPMTMTSTPAQINTTV